MSPAIPPTDSVDFAFFLDKPLVAWNPMLCSMHAAMQHCSAAQASLQKEWVAFVERRLQEDAQLPKRLAQAKAPDQAWMIYRNFVETALHDYREEFRELARLGGSLASDTATESLKAMTSVAVAPQAIDHRPVTT